MRKMRVAQLVKCYIPNALTLTYPNYHNPTSPTPKAFGKMWACRGAGMRV